VESQIKVESHVKNKIVNVYQLKYKGYEGKVDGLGDFIKGSIYLLCLCDRSGFDFDLNISNHPISKFINNDSNLIDINLARRWNYDESFIKSLKSLKSRSVCYTYATRAFMDDTVTSQQLERIKNMFLPSTELNSDINAIINQLNLPSDYNVIHIRTGDVYLIDGKTLSMTSTVLIERKILKYTDNAKKYLILSDNKDIKQYLKKHDNFYANDNTASHLGRIRSDDIDIGKDSLIDFFLMTRATSILTFSVYSWGSGFSECASKLYNVPLRKIRL
jgi:hypothetical protein